MHSKKHLNARRESERGFTLVELAVVMIIIGLLIGGILKGQELIANAQVTSTISQIKGYDAAASTFRETYGVFPGDMGDATTRLPNCTGGCGDAATPNGRLDSDVGVAPTAAGDDSILFFNQMRAADLITGFNGDTTTINFGSTLPSAPVGGGFFAGFTNSAGTTTGFDYAAGMRAGHYIVLTGGVENVSSSAPGSVNTNQAARIDRKLDDGMPESGSVHGGANTGCKDSSTPVEYDVADASGSCSLAIRIQG